MSGAALVRAYLERVWNGRDLGAIGTFVAPDMRYHPPRGPSKDFAGYRAMVERFVGAFPDLHFEVGAAVEQEGLVALRLRITGTHAGGEHLGLAPTGRRVDVQGRPWFRVRDGKVVEVWSLYDENGMLQQLRGGA